MTTIAAIGTPVGSLLKQHSFTCAALEATTGGLISASLQATPKASQFYRGGVSIYSRKAAKALVPLTLLKQLGSPKQHYANPANYIQSKIKFTQLLGAYFRTQMQVDFLVAESGAADPQSLPPQLQATGAFSVVTIVGPNNKMTTKTIYGAPTNSRVENMWWFTRQALNLLQETILEHHCQCNGGIDASVLLPATMSSLVSECTSNVSHVHLKLVQLPTPQLTKSTDVIVRMEAAPINPSDIGVLFGQANRKQAMQLSPTCIAVPISPLLKATFKTDQYGNARQGAVVGGNEGAGTVVAAGKHPKAQALLGKVVAVFGQGGCYAQYRKASALGRSMNAMPSGVTALEAASSYVNPLTALGLLSTAQGHGHAAMVHTAASSQLGQMLVRICKKEGFPLINIVRRDEHVQLLRALDPAAIVLNSSVPTFQHDLLVQVKRTGASVAFDATGGGPLSHQLLNAIAAAGLERKDTVQLYQYGALDTSPSTLSPEQKKYKTEFWLLPLWGNKNKDEFKRNMVRVREELLTTFKSTYTTKIALEHGVSMESFKMYEQQKTGQKVLLLPNGSADTGSPGSDRRGFANACAKL